MQEPEDEKSNRSETAKDIAKSVASGLITAGIIELIKFLIRK